MPSNVKNAVIYGLAGEVLTEDEKALFRDVNPYGYILFARNIKSPEQVKALTASLRELHGDDWLPILIDQEGGRVARLRPPHWRIYPPAATFSALVDGIGNLKAQRACYLNARLLAADLYQLGITVDCMPLLDIPVAGSHDIIGDRAFGHDAETVIAFADAMIHGLEDSGVLPVIKHIPGHGRAYSDSHLELPVVDTPRSELEQSDFIPFRAFRDAPYAMTAHILYTDIDATLPATLSPEGIRTIREDIGFKGILMTDSLSMKALQQPLADRVTLALKAGCDLALDCDGVFDDMTCIAEAVTSISDKVARETHALAKAHLSQKIQFAEAAEWQKELSTYLA